MNKNLRLIFFILLCFFVVEAQAEDWSDEQIADAVFRAEGGDKATWLYGIRSVPYKDEAEARQICLNTIRNQRKRHEQHKCDLTYLECLANRYAPTNAKNDPEGLNYNWLKNVKYFLDKDNAPWQN